LASKREVASVAPDEPSLVKVGSRSTDYRTSVLVNIELKQLGEVRSPVAGIVTSIAQDAGPIQSGEELFAVDGVPVLAHRGRTPLYRELRSGETGPEVALLSQFLSDARLLDRRKVSGTFGPTVKAAVTGLQKRLRVPQDGVFRPSYVAFVPNSATAIGEASVTLASPVAVGDPVLGLAPTPTDISITPASQGSSLAPLQKGALTLTFGDREIAMSGLKPTAGELTAVYTSLREAVTTGAAQMTGGGGGGAPEQYVGGLIRLSRAQERAVVPSTAVYMTMSGAQCLFRLERGTWNPLPLGTLRGAAGELGVVVVDSALVDDQVARDPLSLPANVLAGCT
jgi:peptidoglycan hydrolase-like protein with peptidoglycan-binding domain